MDDEAQVAIFARNYLDKGEFTGWDGRNLFGYRNGLLLNENIISRNPPLDYLTAALSFYLLKSSTLTGRLPFAILGAFTLLIFYQILKDQFKENYPARLFSFGLLALSVLYLLYMRQCRYYALSLFFSQLTYLVYIKTLDQDTLFWPMLISLSSLLNFFSNWLLCGVFLISLGGMHLIFFRKKYTIRKNIHLIIAISIFSAIVIPYAIHFSLWHRPDVVFHDPYLIRKMKTLWFNIKTLNLINVTPWTMAVIVIYMIKTNKMTPQHIKRVSPLICFVGIYVIALSIFSYQQTHQTNIAIIRYLILLLPFSAIISGVCISIIHERNKILAWILLTFLITTNGLSLTPENHRFRFFLPNFIREIHNPYPTSYSEVISFLSAHTKIEDTIYAYPEVHNYPLMAYLGDHLRFCCLLHSDTHLPKEKINGLSPLLFIEENQPIWFIAFGLENETLRLLKHFSTVKKEIAGEAAGKAYTLFKRIPVYYRDTSRPEILLHHFGPVTQFDLKTESILIFKRAY